MKRLPPECVSLCFFELSKLMASTLGSVLCEMEGVGG